MEPRIIDYYNELPDVINVIDKMNEELSILQDKYDLLKKTYSLVTDYPTLVNKATESDNDMAKLLYHLYGKKVVCSSIKKNEWYYYDDEMKKWRVSDEGIELRIKMSNEIHNIYMKKGREYMETIYNNKYCLPEPEPGGDNFMEDHLGHRSLKTCVALKNPRYKQKIMKECKEVFYNKDFLTDHTGEIEDLGEYYQYDYYGDFSKINR